MAIKNWFWTKHRIFLPKLEYRDRVKNSVLSLNLILRQFEFESLWRLQFLFCEMANKTRPGLVLGLRPDLNQKCTLEVCLRGVAQKNNNYYVSRTSKRRTTQVMTRPFGRWPKTRIGLEPDSASCRRPLCNLPTSPWTESPGRPSTWSRPQDRAEGEAGTWDEWKVN